MFEVLETILRKLLEKTQALSIIPCSPLLKTGIFHTFRISLIFLT